MKKILAVILMGMFVLSLMSCTTAEKDPELEPGCLDVIICSESADKVNG